MLINGIDTSWSTSVEGWTINFIRSQVWRTRPMMDEEDLMQEARMVWNAIVKRYVIDAQVATSTGHLMSLYKTSVVRDLHYYAWKRGQKYSSPQVSEIEKDDIKLDMAGGEVDEELVLAALGEDDPVMAKLIEIFLYGKRRPRTRTGESTNDWLRRILGITDANIDVVAYIREQLVPTKEPQLT